jgi:hypothetical protein
VFIAVIAALMTRCGGGSSSGGSMTPGPQSGSAFVKRDGPPLPSVVSFQVDIIGPLTGLVNPMLKAITPSDSDAYVDEFVAGVVSVNASGNSFVIQGPFGHPFTVNVNDQTEWEGSESLNGGVELEG